MSVDVEIEGGKGATGALQSSKAVTTTYYGVYVVASVVFTVLTSRKFAQLSSIVGEVGGNLLQVCSSLPNRTLEAPEYHSQRKGEF